MGYLSIFFNKLFLLLMTIVFIDIIYLGGFLSWAFIRFITKVTGLTIIRKSKYVILFLRKKQHNRQVAINIAHSPKKILLRPIQSAIDSNELLHPTNNQEIVPELKKSQ